MNINKHFSIITICRNESNKIRETCESIVSQKYYNYEWIVIDGASTDGTISILQEYSRHISILVSESDGGIYEAMNKGLSIAKGKYVVFMNGGDSFASPRVLDKVASSPDVDLIYGDIFLNSVSGEVVKFPDQLYDGYLLRKTIPHQATFYNMQLFDRIGNFNTSYRIAADYELYVRMLEIAKVSYYHISEPLAICDQDGISSNTKLRKIRRRENHRVRKKYFKKYLWTLKCLRQEIRDRLFRIKKIFHPSKKEIMS
jgi:glycosyltransferase involved in cell wall biosynthesis